MKSDERQPKNEIPSTGLDGAKIGIVWPHQIGRNQGGPPKSSPHVINSPARKTTLTRFDISSFRQHTGWGNEVDLLVVIAAVSTKVALIHLCSKRQRQTKGAVAPSTKQGILLDLEKYIADKE